MSITLPLLSILNTALPVPRPIRYPAVPSLASITKMLLLGVTRVIPSDGSPDGTAETLPVTVTVFVVVVVPSLAVYVPVYSTSLVESAVVGIHEALEKRCKSK